LKRKLSETTLNLQSIGKSAGCPKMKWEAQQIFKRARQATLTPKPRIDNFAPAHKLSANLYDIYHCCVYSEKLLMMDRGTVRNMQFHSENKFDKLVHLVGFIVRNCSLLFFSRKLVTGTYNEPVESIQHPQNTIA
jgi:hypothetical protein